METRVIWKYPLKVAGVSLLNMPRDAEFLSVQMQAGVPTVWAMVEPANVNVERRVLILATGQHFTDEFEAYIGTVQINGFVWHVFDAGERA